MAIVRKNDDPFLQGESAIKALQSYINDTQINREGMYLLQIINHYVRNDKEEIYQRIPSEVFGGLSEGGRRNVQASALCRAEGSPDAAQQAPIRETGYTKEQEVIGLWAERDGCWSDTPESDLESKGLNHIEEFDGAEARIFYDNKTRIYKTIDHVRYPNLQRFLDRITIHNAYFPECPMFVEGFGMRDYSEDTTGFCVVVSQPFVKGDSPSLEQIEQSLHDRGLVDPEKGAGFYYESPSHSTLVTDVHDMNCVLTEEGNVVFFDCEAHINNIAGFGGKFHIPEIQYDEKAVKEIKKQIHDLVPNEYDAEWIDENIHEDWKLDTMNDLSRFGRTNGQVMTKDNEWVIIEINPMDRNRILVSDSERIKKMLTSFGAPLDDNTVLDAKEIYDLSQGYIGKSHNRILTFDLDKGRVVQRNDIALRLTIDKEAKNAETTKAAPVKEKKPNKLAL